MVSIGLIPLIVLLEVALILLLLSGYLFWRACKKSDRADNLQSQQIERGTQLLTPFLYLDGEATKARRFYESLQSQPGAEPLDPALRSALGLRAGLLIKESEFAKSPAGERGLEEWMALAQHVHSIIDKAGYAIQPKTEAPKVYGEDSPPSEIMVTQQERTIKHLQHYIQQLLAKMGHQPSPDIDVVAQFNELERINNELNQCLAVLEDENGFLRDQIAALLKLDHAAEATSTTV